MKLGRVYLNLDYVVDLNNQEMVDHATESFYEDLMNAVKYDELGNHLCVKEDKEATEDMIPEFLLEQE